MGKMNLLKADYTGTVGETYGYRRKKTSVICATPFSHAPHNQAQKDSFSAFSEMQKFNGLVAREFWYYTGFNAKNKNKINVVAKEFKGLLVNHQYEPQRIEEILPNDGSLTLDAVTKDSGRKVIQITVTNVSKSISPRVDRLFLAVFALDGTPMNFVSQNIDTETVTIEVPTLDILNFYVMGFKAEFRRKDWELCDGVFYGREPDVLGGVWFIDRVAQKATVSINNGILKIDYADMQIDDGVLKLNY